MLVAERRAGVLDRIQLVEDEQVLKMIEAMLEVHLNPLAEQPETASDDDDVLPNFNPLDHHSEEAIKLHVAREDFWGYGIDGQPVYGDDVDKEYEKTMAAVARGDLKLSTHEEVKAKMEKKLSEWRLRTK